MQVTAMLVTNISTIKLVLQMLTLKHVQPAVQLNSNKAINVFIVVH